MGYARIRADLIKSGAMKGWEDANLCDLEGNELYWRPASEWVKAICFDGMGTGLYVLTEDDDSYFTCHSIDLEFADEKPIDYKAMTDGEVMDCIYALSTNDRPAEEQLYEIYAILKEARTC